MTSTLALVTPTFRRHTVAFAAVASLLANPLAAQTTSTSASAQAPATTPPVTNPTANLGIVAEAMYEHDFSASIKNTGNGELSTDQFGLGIKASQDWDQNHLVSQLGYKYINYDFTGIAAPFGSVNELGGSLFYTRDIDAQWGAFGDLAAGIAADTGASFTDGGQVSLAAGPSYKFDQDLSLAVGPMLYTRPEDSTAWTVFGEANWKFMPQWELHAYAGESTGVTAAYDLFNNHQTIVDGTVEYYSHWFEIGPIPAGDRSVDETGVTLKVGVRQIFLDHYFARAYVSLLLDRTYQFHVNGNSANSADVNNTLGLGFEVGTAL